MFHFNILGTEETLETTGNGFKENLMSGYNPVIFHTNKI